ncbi:PREDICTED: phosphatidylinositol N-acetylglucosaminyltransferase subunit H [Tinamus guttatus]|uniref:phosphatidylinositol N-acetylglucosaminyltransferase subunit H n=1 Tax=Tinamus guttatus TaxID=94827 RepID=UPI00052EB53F|nr:PREDICTED: phosphatidylinositol N-acetylglucosaminyltransferase subunit H [Tinamus guttatus]
MACVRCTVGGPGSSGPFGSFSPRNRFWAEDIWKVLPGLQVTSSYASGKESTTFIEMSQVKDVVINEAIHMQKVIYYLCILIRDPQDPQGVSEVVPLFQSSKPRLDCLVEVYKSCQEILAQREMPPQSSEVK